MSKDHCSFLTLWRLTNLRALCKFKADKCQGVGSGLEVLKDISPRRESQEKSFGFLYCLEKSWRRQKRIMLIGPNVTQEKKNPLIHFFSKWKKQYHTKCRVKRPLWLWLVLKNMFEPKVGFFLFYFIWEHTLHLSSIVPQSLIKSSLSTLGKKRTGSLFKQSNFSALGVI